MMQGIIEHRSPVRQGGGDRTQGQVQDVPWQFTPLTEDDLIASYSLSYRHEPDNIITMRFKDKRLVISHFKEYSSNKIYNHSIEQYTKNDNDEYESWYKVSVFTRKKIILL